MPKVTGILETALYVEDLPRAMQFYQTLFHFDILFSDDRACAMSVAGKQVLLLFKKGGSLKPIPTSSGGTIPPHDGSGNTHMAFSISATEFETWEKWLTQNGVAIDSHVTWGEGGRSLYFRDPDNHVIELATPGTWAIF